MLNNPAVQEHKIPKVTLLTLSSRKANFHDGAAPPPVEANAASPSGSLYTSISWKTYPTEMDALSPATTHGTMTPSIVNWCPLIATTRRHWQRTMATTTMMMATIIAWMPWSLGRQLELMTSLGYQLAARPLGPRGPFLPREDKSYYNWLNS